MRNGFVRLLTVSCLAVFFLASTSWAQQVTAAITGKVTDPTGAAVPAAKVVATDKDRGTE
jgi:hypothetical protein